MPQKSQDKKNIVLGLLLFDVPSKNSLSIDETGGWWGDGDKAGVVGKAILCKLPLKNRIT